MNNYTIPKPHPNCQCGCCRDGRTLIKKKLPYDYACTCLNYDDEETCSCEFCIASIEIQRLTDRLETPQENIHYIKNEEKLKLR